MIIELENLEPKIDQLCEEWNKPDSPGCVIGIVHNGDLIYSKGFGLANLEHLVPITKDTVFRIGSTSKQFTATCINLLIEDNLLSLDDPLTKYFPEFPEYANTIKISHLIHHTSGIKDYIALIAFKSL